MQTMNEQIIDPEKKPPREPMFNIPPMTGVLVLILVVIHLVRVFVLTDQQNTTLIFGFSFIPDRMVRGQTLWWDLMTMVTYMVLHIGWTHFMLNTASLLAFGTAVERALGAKTMLGLTLLSGLGGVLLHFAIYPQSIAPVAGASAAVSGLFAAVLILMQRMGRFAPGWRGLMPIVTIWIGLNIVFGLLGDPTDPSVGVAWVAHIGGFVVGLFTPVLFKDKSSI